MSWFSSSTKVKCNNIYYNLPKKGDPPVIGVCLDGTGPNHLAGTKMPNFWSGCYREAHAFLPTVTNTTGGAQLLADIGQTLPTLAITNANTLDITGGTDGTRLTIVTRHDAGINFIAEVP